MKSTVAVSLAVPLISAVNVSSCTVALDSVVVNTPSALVVPVIGLVNVLPVPVAVSVTVASAMTWPLASSAVTVRVVVEVPSAATVDGEAVSDEVACDTAAGTTLMVRLSGFELTPPSLAVKVSVSPPVKPVVGV